MKPNTTLSVSILSGKGGVGKTNFALNLGYCMFKGNHPLLLMDCDLGLANLDVLLGIAPDKNLMDILDAGAEAGDVAVQLEKGGFDFIPAATGLPELVELDEEMRATLLNKLSSAFSAYDFLFMDLGAGITPTVMNFAAMSQMRVVIVTPEPTSLTDGYALIKVLNTEYGITDFQVVVNMVESKSEEKQTFSRLSAACEKFLGFGVSFLGSVRQDKTVAEAVRRQTPLMKMAPQSPAAQDIFAIARKLKAMRDDMLPELQDKPVLAPLLREDLD
ncbi:MAG: MinD/ParA family protein [Desulfovibrio sp.]|nr:MAG: MinD/ParA family protein [Desulfovibrio sp.]